MPQWCPKHQQHTIDEECPGCERERSSSPPPPEAAGTARELSPDDALDIYVPGRWRCPQCEFVLTEATMFVRTGEIGHTREQVMQMSGEACPNDGTPMVRVTWREEAEENYRYATKLIDDILALTGAKSLPEALDGLKRQAEAPPLPSDAARLADVFGFIDDLLTSNPNIIGRNTLQDYARFNRAMMAFEEWKRLRASASAAPQPTGEER